MLYRQAANSSRAGNNDDGDDDVVVVVVVVVVPVVPINCHAFPYWSSTLHLINLQTT
jgi:hypothetical protein